MLYPKGMRASRHGVSFLEVLIVLAVLAVIFAVGFQLFPRDTILLNQAAERFERDLERSRFNAISFNTVILFSVDPANDSYRAVPQPDVATVARASFTVDLSREGVGAVEILPVNSGGGACPGGEAAGPGEWFFDQRGVGRADDVSLITFRHSGTGATVSLCVNSYGRVIRL